MSSPETSHMSSSSKSLRDRDRSHSPTQYRSGPMPAPINVPSDSNASDARHSPTLARTFNPLDPDARERQRTLDVDMAMQLSRARRVSTSSPAVSPIASHDHSHPHSLSRGQSLHDTDDEIMPMFTSFDTLREDSEPLSVSPQPVSSSTPSPPRVPSPSLAGLSHLNPHDPSLLVSPSPSPPPNLTPMQAMSQDAELPIYQPSPLLNVRSTFNFGALEDFARKEKATLIRERGESVLRHRVKTPTPAPQPDTGSPPDTFTLPPPRSRKLSQSLGTPRRQHGGGKMALFENTGGAPPLPILGHLFPHHGGGGPVLSTASSFENLPPPGAGHDERQYRFSFYSNALSATIHARSLAELPAEGQTFEELFTGSAPANGAGSRPGSDSNSGAPSGAPSVKGVGNGAGSGEGGAGASNGGGSSKTALGVNGVNVGELKDLGAHTWWLDVLSPTDEEMRTLSQAFGIHPLTAEDIQMEEAREKIELFRTYYLVCFRSFDQDPYSPTHLEPLNMYIIVFREGTLSFHFRPSPHPQNVRRRIKQLKDYISVTSDWISYALIDDITDAFGPLIQSIEYEVDSIDELVLILKETEQSDMLRRIGRCRKKVMGLLRLMGNKADVVKGLAKRCNENWKVAPTSDIGLYLSDIQDHLITMTQNLNHYEKILSRSHSNYLAQISIEMTDANNQINDVLSKLTALGTVLIPMNLVTGLWGMNVHVPGQDATAGYAWFLSIVGCLAVFALIGGYSTYKFMIG